MGFKCGIVGLPNVGKSTLFNALTNSSKAQAENFPFCTIDPNIGIVPVPDERLNQLVSISNSKKRINTTISFVDIAGLVKFCLNQRGDEHFLDELHLDEFPEGYMGGKLSYLSDEEKVYLTFETFKEVGWLP